MPDVIEMREVAEQRKAQFLDALKLTDDKRVLKRLAEWREAERALHDKIDAWMEAEDD